MKMKFLIFLKKILELRNAYPSLSKGKLTHFPVYNNVYTYFKKWKDELILNIINTNDSEVEIELSNFSHIIKGREKLINLNTENAINIEVKSKILVGGSRAEMYLFE